MSRLEEIIDVMSDAEFECRLSWYEATMDFFPDEKFPDGLWIWIRNFFGLV